MRASRSGAATLTRDVQRGLGEQLRAMYGEMMKGHVPSRHLDLLQRFERNEAMQVAVRQSGPGMTAESLKR
jgi:anti-sigma factor NepR-like protein